MKCKCGRDFHPEVHIVDGESKLDNCCSDCDRVKSALEKLKKVVEAHPRRYPTPEPDGTMGQRAAILVINQLGLQSNCDQMIAPIIDGVIAADTCRRVVEGWQKDRKDGGV